MNKLFVNPDIAYAETLNKDFYLSEYFFQESKQKIFSDSIQFIGHHSELLNSGDCLPLNLLPDFLNEPLLISKDNNGQIHCLSNVCTHRGNVVMKDKCNTQHFRCRYHGRQFELSGKFHSMPEFKEVRNFPTEDDDLKSLPVFNWKNFLFSSLNGNVASEKFLNEMNAKLSWLPVEEFVYTTHLNQEFVVNAHWALYCENYLEGFHIPFVHAGLNQVIDFSSYSTELFPYSSVQVGVAKEDEDCFDLPPGSPDFGKKIAAYYFFIFPNMMFNFYPWGLSLNIIEPVSVNKTRVKFLSYVWKENLLNKGAGSQLTQVEHEDEEIVESVQTGIRSRFYHHGRYSVKHEKGTHHFHQLICEFMNRE
ncbi:MAG TPA: choline monooxygenase [Bacteroidetes bacterium]|nr:choline monooxygenase [Bacteroidota bacterium]